MKKTTLILAMFLLGVPQVFSVAVQVKEITDIAGFKENQLIGYGIVVGLNGTGDRDGSMITVASVLSMLKKLGVKVPAEKIETKNCAAVIVTAVLPPAVRPGERLDVTIASIGNAKSLYGGILLMTPLKAGNGDVYAIAQGALQSGGHNVEFNENRVGKNNAASASIAGGAIVEKELMNETLSGDKISLISQRTDFELASVIVDEINKKYGENTASTADGKNIDVKIPEAYAANKYKFMAELGSIVVEDAGEPSIVLDEKSGTVILGGEIKVNAVAISHGNIHIAVASENVISQPSSFGQGSTVQALNSTISINEDKPKFTTIRKGATLDEIVKGLNNLGVSAQDIIAIVTNMKASGAIKGKIIVR